MHEPAKRAYPGPDRAAYRGAYEKHLKVDDQMVGQAAATVFDGDERGTAGRGADDPDKGRGPPAFLGVMRHDHGRLQAGPNTIWAFTLVAGMADAKSNALMLSLNSNVSVISGLTSILPLPIRARALG